jgi:hypothetical protein
MVFFNMIINRSGCRGSVTDNPEIELNSTRSPGTTQGYFPEFKNMVGIDKFAAGRQVSGSPDFATNFRQDRNLYIFYF